MVMEPWEIERKPAARRFFSSYQIEDVMALGTWHDLTLKRILKTRLDGSDRHDGSPE
jgi:hypothetical protein